MLFLHCTVSWNAHEYTQQQQRWMVHCSAKHCHIFVASNNNLFQHRCFCCFAFLFSSELCCLYCNTMRVILFCAREQSFMLLEIPTGVGYGESLGKTQVEFMPTILLCLRRVLGATFHWLVATSCLKYSMVSFWLYFLYSFIESGCLKIACLISDQQGQLCDRHVKSSHGRVACPFKTRAKLFPKPRQQNLSLRLSKSLN